MGKTRKIPFLMSVIRLVALILAMVGLYFAIPRTDHAPARTATWKLYWFVPDGLRADPQIFRIFDWAKEGQLPNIRRMMEQGSYGYSIPVFPSHTPVNFASLFTGVSPRRHGVADGPIRVPGYPLNIVTSSGFSSVAKTIDPFWFTLEQAGKIVSLLSVPGSTPPEITSGNVVKGRWGGWGIEFPNLVFHSDHDHDFRQALGANNQKLTEFIATRDPEGWSAPPKSYSPTREVALRNGGTDLFALLTDSGDDGQENYDRAHFSLDKKNIFSLKVGEWSDWLPLTLKVPGGVQIPSRARVKVIKLGARDFFRIRVLYDGLNESLTLPQNLAQDLHGAAGPMVDFVDNFPPQLVYFEEDRATFLEESAMSFAWHREAQKFFFDRVNQDVFIQSIYSPNQMLTSRWWMGAIDPDAKAYARTPAAQREQALNEVLEMYRQIDGMIGEALDRRPKDAYVVLSSDHGAVPLNFEVKLNNLFAKKGWLKFRLDPANGQPQIDWAKTKVVFLNMNHVFLKPEGLGGNYHPSRGREYLKLRDEVARAIRDLRDADGGIPLSGLHTREKAATWGLPAERVGDLVIANQVGYGWTEDISPDLEIFATSHKGGYKQAVLPDQARGLWTPFLIVGPGVKAGHRISRPIQHVEQYPTLLKLLNLESGYAPDTPPLSEILGND